MVFKGPGEMPEFFRKAPCDSHCWDSFGFYCNRPCLLALGGGERLLRGSLPSEEAPSGTEPQLSAKATWSFMHPFLASSLSLPHFPTPSLVLAGVIF